MATLRTVQDLVRKRPGGTFPARQANQTLLGQVSGLVRPPVKPPTPGITAPMITPAQQSVGGTRGGVGPTPGAGAGLATAAGISPEQQAAIKQQAQAQIGLRPPTAGGPNIQPPVPQPEDDGPITEFGPGNDLRSSQINPLASNRLRGLQTGVDRSAGALSEAPSLRTAALDRYAEIGQGIDEDRRRGIQDIGRANATLGRLGSGMVTGQLGDLEALLQKRSTAAQRGLAGETAFQEAEDRRANVGTLSGLERQLFGQETGQRDELRSERGYQADTANQAVQNRVQQRLLEEQLLNSGFNRNLAGADLGLRGAEQYGDEAAASGDITQQLLAELGRARAGKKRTSTGTPASDASYAGAGYS